MRSHNKVFVAYVLVSVCALSYSHFVVFGRVELVDVLDSGISHEGDHVASLLAKSLELRLGVPAKKMAFPWLAAHKELHTHMFCQQNCASGMRIELGLLTCKCSRRLSEARGDPGQLQICCAVAPSCWSAPMWTVGISACCLLAITCDHHPDATPDFSLMLGCWCVPRYVEIAQA
jgi:hypothetical protein